MELNSKGVTELQCVFCTITSLTFHCKEECDYVNGSDGKRSRARRICLLFILNNFRGASIMMGWGLVG